jgi:enoyl-[acyl-carrier protein] reductase I
MTPIRRAITVDDVGNTAAFLMSDLSAGISAEIVYVDGGFSHVALADPDAGPA